MRAGRSAQPEQHPPRRRPGLPGPAKRVSQGERRVMFDVSSHRSKLGRLLRAVPAFRTPPPPTFSL